MTVSIYIGNSKLDLYKDESISITSSVLNIEDVTKNTTDYTKSFTVPASDNNNQIFKHYYNADVDNTFDARIKADGRIELDGIPFRIGKFLLQKVKIKQGKPSSYTINFWGNLVSISDSVGKDYLSSLDLTAFNHEYNSENVKLGLQGSLFSGDIIYNLIAKKQYYFTSDLNDTTQTDALANIHYNSSADTGVIWNDLRPSLRLIKIIEAIETDYGLTFSRDFFGGSEFTSLYMWMNNEKGNAVGGGTLEVDFDSGNSTYMNLTTNIGTYIASNTSASNDEVYFEIALNVFSDVSNVGREITIKILNNGEILQETTTNLTLFLGSAFAYNPLLKIDNGGGSGSVEYNLTFEVTSTSEIDFDTRLIQYKKGATNSTYFTYSSTQTITSQFETINNLPKISIIDFLKGIFQMFKLVVIPKSDGTIYVNTLKDYYLQGSLYDVTKYINFDTYDVSRGNILSQINYNFQEPTTILNDQFLKNEGVAYGDLESVLKDNSTGEVLEGDSIDIQLPFEQFIYERLIDLENGESTNIVYSAIVDDKLEQVNPKPHIFYNIPLDIDGKNIGFINENGTSEQLTGLINNPSHVDDINAKNYSTVFGSEFNEYDGVKIENTLYSNYHQEYINNVFNIKRRNYDLKASVLPLSILLKLELNDMLKIKDNYFRIDSFTTDLVSSQTSFKLVNSFDYTLGGFSTQTTNIQLSKEAQTYSAYVTNLGNYSINKIDSGFGIDWITVSDDGSGNLLFTVTENLGLRRYIFIDITNTDTNQTIQFYINQEGIIIKADTTAITVDTTLITADYV
jgi:hypothetical protein